MGVRGLSSQVPAAFGMGGKQEPFLQLSGSMPSARPHAGSGGWSGRQTDRLGLLDLHSSLLEEHREMIMVSATVRQGVERVRNARLWSLDCVTPNS